MPQREEEKRAGFDALASRIRHLPRLQPAEEAALVTAARGGSARARAKLIEAHMPVALAVATRRRAGRDIEDAFSEAMIGIATAVDRFEPGRGARVGRLAKAYAQGAVNEYMLRTASLVRIPDTTKNHAIFRRIGDLTRSASNVGQPDIAATTRLAAIVEVTPAEVTKIWLHASPYRPLGDAGLTEHQEGGRPDTEVAEDDELRHRRAELERGIRSLDAQEADVIRSRSMADRPTPFKEIGRRHGKSAERARQIHQQAVEKLRRLVESG